ncbi:protein of unknown function [Rhizobium sp. RU35A]|nr:protein of unknown function [Rhizobium sp. RU35A]
MSDARSGRKALTIMNNRSSRSAGLKAGTARERLFDKHKQHLHFAAMKLSAGDRIGAESEFQHAEHFFRSASEQNGGGRQ